MAPKKDKDEKLTRVAIVESEKCKPRKCQQECKSFCPVNRMGKACIEVAPNSKVANLSEVLCIGCGICVKRCPFKAIQIINLPKNLEKETTHRYGPNSFKLHRLPMPRPSQVLGLVGTNGIGKSTAVKILAGKLKPNLGRYDDPPDWEEILLMYRGSELQNYFTKILQDDLKAIVKIQWVDKISAVAKGKVSTLLKSKADRGDEVMKELTKTLDLDHVLDRNVDVLSGGELQRFAICIVCVQRADAYLIDEPSSYLDIRQRLNAARTIRSLTDVGEGTFVTVIEHDLAILDYMSDFICCLYGTPGAYGVVTMPFNVRDGINIFLAGFLPTENLRFRDSALSFKVAQGLDEREIGYEKEDMTHKYRAMSKTLYARKTNEQVFKLNVSAGGFSESQIIVLLGENGCGKTTLVRMIAGLLRPDGEEEGEENPAVPQLAISYKPQKISPKLNVPVRALLMKKIKAAFGHPTFQTEVVKPMMIEELLDQPLQQLSGGELQRVAIVLALGTPGNVYLIDEPSAYLDSSQRIVAAKVIRRFVISSKRSAFIVEHDFVMSTYLADRVIVYTGTPGVECTATPPKSLLEGMNQFLKQLDITFRRDDESHRPRINKGGSQMDTQQKKAGTYFHVSD
ncbi:ABC transporter ATP-binding protein [Hondaea fermentalgiana]|uniref:ABC transporter ATP-binding protein n=1 Tax=Hondaea fermentalgiana TaxID=2315210 RepID=A0A2R5G9J3_9STRA|nr:ABC transporter ATP-binding protein [Hondaea fermentalgiana]|eukprot:GBG26428.1 ABC transporter ATP-binding protein [Hondaea fermentalgiana]